MSATHAVLALTRRLRQVTSRRAGLALAVRGEAGIGKTHSVRTAMLELPCRSAHTHAAVTLPTLIRHLPPARHLPAWADTTLARTAQGESVPDDALQDALAAHLAAIAPFVLHVEDLHEAGEARHAFWCRLARAAAHLPGVAVIATTRGTAPDGFDILQLEPLDEAASAATLEAEADAPLPAEAKHWVYEWARGNPLFTVEYFRALARSGNLWSDGRQWRWRPPEPGMRPATVEAIIEDVLAGVHALPDAATLLDALTLLPVGTCVQRAARLAGLEDDRAAAATHALERAGILRAGAFAHPLYREVHHASLPADRVRVFARGALAHLHGEPEMAAWFLDPAGIEGHEAIPVLHAAMHAAAARGNDADEARYAWQAAERLSGPERARYALHAALTSRRVNVARACEYARAAFEAHATPDTLALLVSLLAQTGRGEEAEAMLAAHRADTPEWWDARIELLVQRSDLRGAVTAWQDAPRAPQGTSADTQALVASAFLNLGELEQARELAEAGLAQTDAPVSARARFLNVLGGVLYFTGAYERGEACQHEAIRLYLNSNRLSEAAGLYGNRALTRSAQGRLQDAMQDLEEALRLLECVGDGRQYAFQQQRLGALHARAGTFERAEELLMEARDVLVRADAAAWRAECESELAKLYLEWAPPHAGARARRHAQAALRLARQVGARAYLTDALFVAAWAEAVSGDAHAALALADELDAFARGGPRVGECYGTWARALALEATGRTDDAIGALRDAASALHAANIDVLAWRVRFEVARLTGDAELAREGLRFFAQRGMHGRNAPALRYFPALADAPAEPAVPAGSRYRLLLLGPIELQRDGEPQAIRGRQVRSLLAHLGQASAAGRAEVPQLELVDTLYPGQDETRAVGALQQLVHRLRDTYGPGLVVSTPLGYALGADVMTDAADFLRAPNVRAWRGPYLGGLEPSGALHAHLHRVLHDAARAQLSEDPALAAQAGEILLATDPFDTAALRLTIEGLRAARAHRRLARVYADAKARFLEVGERLPDSWQDFLQFGASASEASRGAHATRASVSR